jgi:hypothetical protein
MTTDTTKEIECIDYEKAVKSIVTEAYDSVPEVIKYLSSLISRVQQAERAKTIEECAKLLDSYSGYSGSPFNALMFSDIAKEIRKLQPNKT